MIGQDNWQHLASVETTSSAIGVSCPIGNFNSRFATFDKLKIVWSAAFLAASSTPTMYDGLGAFASSYRTRWWTYNAGSTSPSQTLTSTASGLALSGASTGSTPGRLFGTVYASNVPNPLTNERVFSMYTTYITNGVVPVLFVGTGSTTYTGNPIGRIDLTTQAGSAVFSIGTQISVFGCNYRD